ncbi:MAG TPA: 4a-hydroxytetrahydrobiopterin dehydratase [Tenuifilaceae bacterium]|nr:4a-hydroxytetrahydrobiopterin dehydratase [Tenuifilaceae bacterium]
MWKEENNQLVKSFEFDDFTSAFAFMQRVALVADTMNHHPDWRNVYNRVEIRLSTHDAGNVVTLKDWELANRIDKLEKQHT